MRYVNSGWLQAVTTAPLNDRQRSLLERVLFALDDAGHLGQNVASLPSALVALIRAQAALQSHGSGSNQPHFGLLGRIVAEAVTCVDGAEPVYRHGGHAALAAAGTELQAVAAVIAQKKEKTPPRQTQHAATQLDQLLGPLTDAVKGWVKPLWTGGFADRSLVERAVSEIAVVVALEGRDSTALYEDALTLMRRGAPSADAVRSVLWPRKQSYLVSLLVHGTRELRGLHTFVPDSQQWKLWAGQPEADLPGRFAIRKMMRTVGPVAGSAVVVGIKTQAADLETAARIARRELSEALDHYAAGDRLIDLTIDPAWAAELPSSDPKIGTVRVPGQRASYPLTGYMPDSLRAAMRAANLARRVDAPVASAALSWSALESSGLKATKVKLLAGACALQTLRRHLASAHTLLVAGSRSHLDYQQHRVGVAKGQLRGHEHAARSCEQTDSPQAKAALPRQLREVDDARARLRQAELDLEAVENEVTADLATLAAFVPTEGMKERLTSFHPWLEVLLPAVPASPPALQKAQAAAIRLAKRCGGIAAETFALWRSRMANPKDLADWLEIQAGMYQGVLEWLYATRNLAFHRGHFTAPSDELTAHAARGIVDMALEFLSNWHTVERVRTVSQTPAEDVHRHLGDRLTRLVGELRRPGAACSPLRVDHITGPDPTWWVPSSTAGNP
ncbi:hypothetical protein ACWGII_39650 [Streptomyces sp. NPDC054855]